MKHMYIVLPRMRANPCSTMINPYYLSDTFITPFAASFRSRQPLTLSGPPTPTITAGIYPVALWPDFLDPLACEHLRTELAAMPFTLRSSDLYEFHQTTDLKHLNPQKNPYITQLCRELYSPAFLGAMQRITGRKLGSHVDISGQRYQQGDFLLCHDDRLEKRRIALILYLVEKDAVLEGGRLFALRSDEEGRPVMNDPQTITPQYNTLAFFEVSRFSFHQVEQVFSQQVPRYSITCWFHDEEEAAEQTVDTQSNVRSLFPVKFGCTLDIDSLLKDISLYARPVHRQYVHGFYLSCAQYTSPTSEPFWMSQLLSDSFHRRLEQITGWHLDWPTRPVAWILTDYDHYYLADEQVDRQQDVEYNYKDRTVNVAAAGQKLHLSLIIKFPRYCCAYAPLKPFFKLDTKPLRIKKLPSSLEKLIVVTMKFNKSLKNQRTL